MAEEETKTTQTEEEEIVAEESGPTTSEEAGRGLRYQKSNATCKRCRRLGQKLFLKGEKCFTQNCPFIKRKYAPGQHGQKPSRISDYGRQLQAKQKAAAIYGLTNKQLLNVFKKATMTPSSTKKVFIKLLESRLDSVLYQANLALSRKDGRQLSTHGKVKVDGQKVTSPSYQISKGEKIEVKSEIIKNQSEQYKRLEAEKQIPDWIKKTADNKAEIKSLPTEIKTGLGFDISQIIEFYSR